MRSVLRRLAQSFLGASMLVHVDDLRRYIAAAPSLPLNQDRAEVRIYATAITVAFLLLLMEPIYYICFVPGAPISRVIVLAPSRWCVIGAFGTSIAATLPHLWTLMFRSALLDRQCYRIAATLAALIAGVTWVYLANIARGLDIGGVEWPYVMRALAMLAIATIYGYSVNAQQMREQLYAADD